MSCIKERVLQIIEYQKVSKEAFFKRIGMSSSNFRSEARKTPLNSDAIANILAVAPEINPEWLITGNGEMLRRKEVKVGSVAESEGDTEALKEMLALYKDLIAEKDRVIKLLEQQNRKEKNI